MADSVPKAVEAFLRSVDDAVGRPFQAVLFGSVARGTAVEGVSDINLLLILPDTAHGTLRALGPALARWRRDGQTPPLLADAAEWHRAADAFPVELTDMRGAYRVLRGSDPFLEVSVARADLRTALERELRGKLLQLRRGYVAFWDDEPSLGKLAGQSAASFLTLLRCTLVLAGRAVPADPLAVVGEAAQLAGFEAAPVREVARHRREVTWSCPTTTFEGYLDAVARITSFMDSFTAGENA